LIFVSICEREREKENSVHRRFSCPSDNETQVYLLILRSNRSSGGRAVLWRRSAAASLLESLFRISLRTWVFLCVLLIIASVTAWSLVQKSPNARARVCVCVCLIVCDLEIGKSGDLGPSWVVAHKLYVFSVFRCEVDEKCEVLKL
jgi:hypothetical protein